MEKTIKTKYEIDDEVTFWGYNESIVRGIIQEIHVKYIITKPNSHYSILYRIKSGNWITDIPESASDLQKYHESKNIET